MIKKITNREKIKMGKFNILQKYKCGCSSVEKYFENDEEHTDLGTTWSHCEEHTRAFKEFEDQKKRATHLLHLIDLKIRDFHDIIEKIYY